ncbi:MAG TPA: hypothetical protein EYP85_15665 [Armatimonadetes bacterium]|nr:hypothetical protein [Armatimonadota bacterium]
MRTILFTGKGGVGKTTLAAATALRAAGLGYKTLVMSTDPAHSLSDAFDWPLAAEPQEIEPRLWGMEIDAQRELEVHWGEVRKYLSTLFASQGLEDIVAEEIALLPGMDELVSLLNIKRFHDEGEYEVLIVDCAPTGATLRLLNFPDIARWYMKRLFPIHRRIVAAARPVARHLLPFPLPDEEVYDSIADFYLQVGALKEILTDPQMTTMRLVLNLEKMVLQETRRAFTYASLFGLNVDAVLVNRVLPEEVTDPYFAEWKTAQEGYLGEVQSSFAPLPVFILRLFAREVVGRQMLQEVASVLYADRDPTQVFFQAPPLRIEKVNGNYALWLKLPFITKAEVNLYRSGEELIVRAGAHKRHVFLPQALAQRPVAGARFEGMNLVVTFGGK